MRNNFPDGLIYIDDMFNVHFAGCCFRFRRSRSNDIKLDEIIYAR